MMRPPGATLRGVFRRDRPLFVAFCVLALSALAPLFASPLLPSPDLPGNIGSAALLFHTALGHASTRDYYRVLFQPFPYWTGYLSLGALTLAVGPFAAAKIYWGALVLALPLGVTRLAVALGRDPRIGLWAFLLSWEHNLYAGWHSYVLGMALALFVIARFIEANDDRSALRVAPWAGLLALTHALALGFAGLVCLAAAVLSGRATALKKLAFAYGPTALVIGPWLLERGLSAAPRRGASLSVEYPSASHKVSSLFSYSLDNVPGAFGELTTGLAFALLLLGPLVLAAVLRPRDDAPDQHRLVALAPALVALVLYAALPMTIYGPVDHWYTYPRFASYFLAGLLLVPRAALDGRRSLALAPGLALAVAGNAATFVQLRAFAQRAGPFVDILASIPPGKRLLPLEYVRDDPSFRLESLAHVHSYLTGARALYDPHLYDNPNTPIQYRRDVPIRRIPWMGPRDFTLERYAPYYDLILVQGKDSDPLVTHPSCPGYHVRLVSESGIFRLYAIDPD